MIGVMAVICPKYEAIKILPDENAFNKVKEAPSRLAGKLKRASPLIFERWRQN